MFKNLFDCSYKRTVLSAVGFFFFHLLCSTLAVFVIGFICSLFVPAIAKDSYATGYLIGRITVKLVYFLYSLIFAVIMILSKNIGSKPVNNTIIITILAILLFLMSVGHLGLVAIIVPTVLTTFNNTRIKQG